MFPKAAGAEAAVIKMERMPTGDDGLIAEEIVERVTGAEEAERHPALPEQQSAEQGPADEDQAGPLLRCAGSFRSR
jgi:hypothetical protein